MEVDSLSRGNTLVETQVRYAFPLFLGRNSWVRTTAAAQFHLCFCIGDFADNRHIAARALAGNHMRQQLNATPRPAGEDRSNLREAVLGARAPWTWTWTVAAGDAILTANHR
jgi:hypothetical protein